MQRMLSGFFLSSVFILGFSSGVLGRSLRYTDNGYVSLDQKIQDVKNSVACEKPDYSDGCEYKQTHAALSMTTRLLYQAKLKESNLTDMKNAELKKQNIPNVKKIDKSISLLKNLQQYLEDQVKIFQEKLIEINHRGF